MKSKSLSQTHQTKLTKEENSIFSISVIEYALAKGMTIQEGVISVWSKLVKEDIENEMFTLQQFLQALKVCIRRPSYGRVDYSDCYKEAIGISFFSTKEICPVCNVEMRPNRFSAMCGISWSDEHTEISLRMSKIEKEYKELFK